MWLGATNGARSECNRDRRPKQHVEHQEGMVPVGMVLRAENRMPRVFTGGDGGRKQ
jgi:hypothetical protein